MTTPTTKPLTDGQQGVIHSYDYEIAHVQRQLKAAETTWNNGGSYDDIRYFNQQLDTLTKERRETLATFEAENNPVPEPPLPAVFTEPQTAAYQAAVDNVWFEIEAAARNIKSTWFIRDEERYDDRVDYVVDLQQQMKRALGTNGRDLAYRIRN